MFAYIKSKKFVIPSLIVFVTAGLLAGCQSQSPLDDQNLPVINPALDYPTPLENYPDINHNPDIGIEFLPVAENEILRLYINRENSAIIVEDLRSGALWESSPEDLDSHEGTTNIWRSLIRMPIQISYTDAARAQEKNIKPEEVTPNFHAVESGVRVNYASPSYDIALDVDYTIRGDCLEATIIADSIIEGAENSLVSIDMLAFMGAAHDDEDGYMVYPDGSGALVYFNTPHPPEVQKILTTIYGVDDASDESSVYREQIMMPVFGMVKGSSAFVGMLTHGDFDAELGIARSGKGVNYNHVWAQFIYRRQGRFSLTGGQPALLYQPDRIPGDRQVRYCFLNDQDANYVEMATRYRQYLINERGATRVSERLGDDVPWMNLIFFMGIERRNWFLSDMVLMTQFEDVVDIMTELSELGISQADVSLWFWNKGGTSGKYPQRFPVDERLGGEDELKILAEGLNQLGYRVYLQDEYLFSYPGSRGIQPFRDAVRGVDGLPAGDPESGYLINPQVTLREFVLPGLPTIASYGVDGLLFEHFAETALPDKNTRDPLSRENFAATWMAIADASREQLGSVAMVGGNIYAVPYSDRLDFVTLDSTHFDLFDESIPFYHIAVHGLVAYTSAPYNFLSDNQRMFLKQIEHGALPIFMLTKKSSSLLFRTGANGIYSSQYDTWRDEIIRQYQSIQSLAPTISQFITAYSQLAEGIYSTTYEDGIQVIVNYNDRPYNLETGNVPPMDFIVLGGN